MSKNRDKKKREQKKYLERVRRHKAKKSITPHQAELMASLPPGMQIVDSVPGLPKMSEQLEVFIEPYVSEEDSLESRRRLLLVGQVAWNVALRPPQERVAMVADVVKTFQDPGSEEIPVLLGIIAALVQRKETEPRFARDKRIIASFVLSELPHEWHLQVASIVPPGSLPSERAQGAAEGCLPSTGNESEHRSHSLASPHGSSSGHTQDRVGPE